MIIRGRKVVGGAAEGEILISPEPVSFFGGVDPDTGVITEPGHPCLGKSISGKVFVFPTGKGSTVGSYIIYRMMKQGTAPIAIINRETEAIIATGCAISGIPLVDRLEEDPIKVLNTGMRVRVRADEGVIDTG